MFQVQEYQKHRERRASNQGANSLNRLLLLDQ